MIQHATTATRLPPLSVAPHGSPYDRGDADNYYGRRFQPHKRVWPDGDRMQNPMAWVDVTDLTTVEKAEYERGWDENPSGRKEW